VGATSCCGSGDRIRLARYRANGRLDTTFSGDGRLTLGFPGAEPVDARGRAVTLQPYGKIVLGLIAPLSPRRTVAYQPVVKVGLDWVVCNRLPRRAGCDARAVRTASRVVERQHVCDASCLDFRFAPGRPPTVAAEAMVATSQTPATRVGLRALERGGNAVDAALAAAAVLCVAEPMSTGIGGDAFALLWHDDGFRGLDAAGPAPARAEPVEPVEVLGPRSVTVPGSVGGWAALAERFGRLGLDACLADAIDLAERGVAAGARTAEAWQQAGGPAELGPAPRIGEWFRLPELAGTLRRLAENGPDAFYRGDVAASIASVSWLEEADLAAYEPRWVQPLTFDYRGVTVVELPPPTQGIATLEGLGLLALGEPSLLAQIECVRLALADARERVRDGAEVSDLMGTEFLAERRHAAAQAVSEPSAGTVYLCAVDGDGTAVSFIQSLYSPFGSGLVAPGTGVALQNRGSCFAVSGRVEPGRRPYHTIIPGMLAEDRALLGPFGVMGGFLQAQAHVQLVSALVDGGLDPQAALDQARFRVGGDVVRLEEGLWHRAAELEAAGLRVVRSEDRAEFGGGQAILRSGDAWLGGSDARKDGQAAGF
jgi:gamma-glutamyltranspeptidase / glutathione hydrolase